MNTFELDKEYIAPTYARFPLTLVEGKGSLVYDDEGKEVNASFNYDIDEDPADPENEDPVVEYDEEKANRALEMDYATNNMVEKIRTSVETIVSIDKHSEFSKSMWWRRSQTFTQRLTENNRDFRRSVGIDYRNHYGCQFVPH